MLSITMISCTVFLKHIDNIFLILRQTQSTCCVSAIIEGRLSEVLILYEIYEDVSKENGLLLRLATLTYVTIGLNSLHTYQYCLYEGVEERVRGSPTLNLLFDFLTP